MDFMEFMFKLFDGLPRQGPGDYASTKKAFELLTDLPKKPSILDVGCGTGMQSINLAKLAKGKIIAIDLHQGFLDTLNERAEDRGISHRIKTLKCSMDAMSFDKEMFDIIWSEGAIYNMGFEKGLEYWKQFVKVNGYVVVSEITWLKGDQPDEVYKHWYEEYPDMKTVFGNKEVIKKLGYELIGHFTLPDSVWWEKFYKFLTPRIKAFRRFYKDDPEANKILDHEENEMELFRKYSDYYGYVFYIMKKV